jgi:hypothetical protein
VRFARGSGITIRADARGVGIFQFADDFTSPCKSVRERAGDLDD